MPRHDRAPRGGGARSRETGRAIGGAAHPESRQGGRADSRRDDRARPRPPGIDLAALRARLREVVEPVVGAAGYDLEDLVVSRAGRRHLLRIAIDADGGVSLDAVAEVSREVSAALDEAERAGGDFGTGEYVLEVGSPGVDRPLTQARHWRRNLGRLVAVRAAGQQIIGRIVAADERSVTLEVDQDRREFALADLGPGRVQIEFGRLDEFEDDDDGDLIDGPAGADGWTLDDEREEDEE